VGNVVVKAFVVNAENEVLLLHRSGTDTRRPNQWDLPGGWRDKKVGENGEEIPETVFETAARECWEEAGLVVSGLREIYETSDETPHGPCTWVAVLAQVEGRPEVTLGDEHDDCAWVSPTEIPDMIEYHRYKRMAEVVIQDGLLPA